MKTPLICTLSDAAVVDGQPYEIEFPAQPNHHALSRPVFMAVRFGGEWMVAHALRYGDGEVIVRRPL